MTGIPNQSGPAGSGRRPLPRGPLGVVVPAGPAAPASWGGPARPNYKPRRHGRRPLPGECEPPAPGGRAGGGGQSGRCGRGPRPASSPRPARSSPGRRGDGAAAMQSESGIVPDFEVGEEFHEEPKTYYELKSQPLKSR